ncbi:hypothetical protein F4604DRAFT_1932756 [Suillus subluteus]|nr:hypothetical protein F4604DRAFT_1932756 [Suillus subluteus]
MPYFPTESAWTHAIQPPMPSKPPTPPHPPSSSPSPACHPRLVNANLRQTTIAFPNQPEPPQTRTPSTLTPRHLSPSSNLNSGPNSPPSPFDFHKQSVDLLKELYPPMGFGDLDSSTPPGQSGSPNAFDSPTSYSFTTANELRIWQPNLNASLTVQASLLNNHIIANWDIIAIQEPHINFLRNTSANHHWHVLYPTLHYTQPQSKTRAVTLISTSLDTNSWKQVSFPSSDAVVIQL